MNEFLLSLFGMAVPGLAYLVYKHPDIAKNILPYAVGFIAVFHIIHVEYIEGKIEGFDKSFDIISDATKQTKYYKDISENRFQFLMADSLKSKDSLTVLSSLEIFSLMKNMELADSISNKLEVEKKIIINDESDYRIYSIIGLAILLVMYVLADIFYKQRNDSKENKEN